MSQISYFAALSSATRKNCYRDRASRTAAPEILLEESVHERTEMYETALGEMSPAEDKCRLQK